MLARSPFKILRASSVGITLLLGACFDPDPTPFETESVGLTDGSTTTGGTVCEPGMRQDCVCTNDQAGTQTCSADGSGFGACECGGVDSTTTMDLDTSTTEPPPPPECTEDADCADMAKNECQEGVCTPEGTCAVEFVAAGTACGDDAQTECSGADACDGRGACSANDAADGTACTECDLGVCSCTAGACGDCPAFAPENNFITTRSIAGWTLTGGWGLYRAAPQTASAGPTVFAGQVFGTDGNRIEPYPGNDNENSAARSRPFVLPATLEFLSWNQDEGSGVDTKQVRVSNDGGATFTTLVDCTANPGGQPFCQFRNNRDANDWDVISLPVPPAMVGSVGVVEFTYVTGDGCCGFEKGWFIDVANLAPECACVGDEGCGGLGSDCGAAVCGGSGECELDAVAAGTDCGDATDVECNAPDACDGLGYCATNVAATGLTDCFDCAAGPGACNACQEGVCVDCVGLAPTNDFSPGDAAFAGWVIEDLSATGADWRIYGAAPQSQIAGSTPTNLSFSPSFGTDGNRQAPYPGLELEHSRITTTPDTVPPQITFSSWHVDEGTTDNKIIELSVDGGVTWTTLVNCIAGVGTPRPFCNFRNDPRAGTEWDAIVIDTAAFAGQVGQLRFTYNTGDACCNFERGWFIDNLNFAQYCNDSPFPAPPV